MVVFFAILWHLSELVHKLRTAGFFLHKAWGGSYPLPQTDRYLPKIGSILLYVLLYVLTTPPPKPTLILIF